MFTLHVPRQVQQVSKAFKGTDPGAWMMLAFALGTACLVVAAFVWL